MKEAEDIFRLAALGLDWDIGVRVYEPQPAANITRGADGKKVGIFLLHGGAGDYKSMEKFALLFAEKFAFKVVTMTFPGRLYLDDDSRDWPGDTIHADGTVRTPIWLKGEHVTPDQYELVRDTGKRMKYGTRTSARAKPGTRFYDRMASWPMAFEEGMKEACRRHFPVGEFSVYVHGHSTGGPYVSMLISARAEHRRRDRDRELDLRRHQREEAPVGRPRRQDRGLQGGRDEERRSRGRTRSTTSTSAPGAISRATAAPRRSARKGPHRADAAALADGGSARRLGGCAANARSSRPST